MLLIKNMQYCLQFFEHGKTTILNEFNFVFIPYFIRTRLPKKMFSKVVVWEKNIRGDGLIRGLYIEAGLQTFCKLCQLITKNNYVYKCKCKFLRLFLCSLSVAEQHSKLPL